MTAEERVAELDAIVAEQREQIAPIEAIMRGVAPLKRTWYGQLVGNFGIGLIVGAAMTRVLALNLAAGALAVAAVLAVALVGGTPCGSTARRSGATRRWGMSLAGVARAWRRARLRNCFESY